MKSMIDWPSFSVIFVAAVHVVDRERRERELARRQPDEVAGDDHEAVVLGELTARSCR